MSDELDDLCAQYLDRLRAALRGLNRVEREQVLTQVGEHLNEVRSALARPSASAMLEAFERLGTPEEIAAAAGLDLSSESRSRRASPWVGAAAGSSLLVLAIGIAALTGAFDSGVHHSPAATTDSPIVVPNVEGQTSVQATRLLHQAGLKSQIDVRANQLVPRGIVMQQAPVGGVPVSRDQAIDLAVSAGPTSWAVVVVPNVIGVSPAQAAGSLQSVGLYNSIDNLNCSSNIGDGHSVSQAPSPGSRVASGTRISVQISCTP